MTTEKAEEKQIRSTTTYFEWRREVGDVLAHGGRKAGEFRAP